MTKKNTIKDKGGRPVLFTRGATPQQDFVALLLAMGKSIHEVAKLKNLPYERVRYWCSHEFFQNLIQKYKNQFIQKIMDENFDDIKFLTDTMVDSMESKPHRSDGLKARELLAKLKGEFSPEKRELVIKEELKKLSDKDLEKFNKLVSNVPANTTTTDSSGNTTEK